MSRNLKEGDKRLGNQFWKLRSKHGKDKDIESPEALRGMAYEYFEWVINNPLYESVAQKVRLDQFTEEIQIVQVPKLRPFTWDALEIYIGHDLERYKSKDDSYKDFAEVITHIGKIIRTQKFEGAAVGIFNSNIIARDLGLADKKESDNKHTVTGIFPEDLRKGKL